MLSFALNSHRRTTSKSSRPLTKFRKMQDEDIELFATILCHQPPPTSSRSSSWWKEYSSKTKEEINKLPEHLKDHPTKIQHFCNKKIDDSTRAQILSLCPLHDKMNRKLVRSTLAWIKGDVDIHIPGILSPLVQNKLIDPRYVEPFDILTDISAMWLESAHYKAAYNKNYKPRWSRQNDRCAGCVLGRLASDLQVLVALRAGLIARGKKESSRRMTYISCIMKQFNNSWKASDEAMKIGLHIRKALETLIGSSSEGNAPTDASKSTQHDSVSSTYTSYLNTLDSSVHESSRPHSPHAVSPVRETFPEEGPAERPTSSYKPIPWRDQAKNVFDKRIKRLTDHYRRTVYEPAFGKEDHTGFDEEPEEDLTANQFQGFSFKDEERTTYRTTDLPASLKNNYSDSNAH